MKAIKSINGSLACRYEDAVFYKDDTCQLLTFAENTVFLIGKRERIDNLIQIDKDAWTEIYPSLAFDFSGYKAEAGETSWGGAAFIGLKKSGNDSYEWLIHLSTLNNPQRMWIQGNTIHLITDLNYPEGLEFLIPVDEPEKIKAVYAS